MKIFNPLINILFPRVCINCRNSLYEQEQFLCKFCKINLPQTPDIKTPSKNNLKDKFISIPKVKTAISFLYFNKFGMVQKLLHELKYNQKKELGVEIGIWFGQYLSEIEADYLIPVPLHKTKEAKRGFNQSEQIAIGLAKELGISVRTDLVIRQKATISQTKKNKMERWENMENVYMLLNLDEIKGKNIAVIDDVITTGATLGILVEKLVDAEANSIHILTVARRK